jgi:hypothetical protein
MPPIFLAHALVVTALLTSYRARATFCAGDAQSSHNAGTAKIKAAFR